MFIPFDYSIRFLNPQLTCDILSQIYSFAGISVFHPFSIPAALRIKKEDVSGSSLVKRYLWTEASSPDRPLSTRRL